MVGTNVVPEKDVSEFTFSFAAKFWKVRLVKQKNLISLLLVLPMFCVRLYCGVVPRGASLEPFVGYSRELKRITPPQGKMYRVFVNDAGAIHSGNHWVWVVDHGGI